MDNIYFSGERAGNGWVNREPTPDQVRVTIAYSGDEGDQYVDHFDLDVMLIRGRTSTTSSADPDQRLKAISQAVNKMSQSLAGLHAVFSGRSQVSAKPLPKKPHRAADGTHPR